ncbi:glycosyltransferase family 2 protein [Thermodesulfobacteriota bacterium]
MKSPPLITAIVVTLNHLNLLRNCLDSLHKQDYEAMEVIVVDNGSEEDVRGLLSRAYPETRMIRLDRNYGFAEANNRGIEMAQGKYIALINNDAVAQPQWISSMVATAEADPTAAAIASIIIDGNRPNVLDSCGVGIGLDGMSRQAMRGKAIPNLDKPKEVLLFSGCACLLRKGALEQVGLFDKDFFAYCEDTDLGLRLQRAGWSCVVAPNARVYHHYSMTGGKYSLQKIYWVERNHFWVAVKNYPWFLLVLLPTLTAYRYLAQVNSLLKHHGELQMYRRNHSLPAIAGAYLKAFWQTVVKLPAMFNKRREFKRKGRISGLEFLRLLWKFRLPVKDIIDDR